MKSYHLINISEAGNATNSLRMQAASEVGVSPQNGLGSTPTSREAGSVGGQR